MSTAKLFTTGSSQAVRLPKAFRFEGTEVEIFRRGDEVVLRPRDSTGAVVFDVLVKLPDDFMKGGRDDTPAQERESL